VATFVYNGSEDEGRDAFKKFFEISEWISMTLYLAVDLKLIEHLVDQTKERPYEELNGMLVCFTGE